MALLRYSLLRLLVLLASLALLYLVGARGWLWLILSVVVAAGVSYLVLPRQRDAAAGTLQARAQERREHAKLGDADAEAEDAAIDAAGGSHADGGGSAQPQGEGEAEGDHELQSAHVPQHADEVDSAHTGPDDAGEGHGDGGRGEGEQRGER